MKRDNTGEDKEPVTPPPTLPPPPPSGSDRVIPTMSSGATRMTCWEGNGDGGRGRGSVGGRVDDAALWGSEESKARTDIVMLCDKAESRTAASRKVTWWCGIKLSLQRACALTIRLKPLCWLFRCYHVKKKLTKSKTEYAWWVDWSLSRQTLHMSLYFCLRRNLMIWSGWKKTCFLPDIPASQFILWIILPWQQAQHTPLATTWPPTHFMAWPLSSFLQAQTQG